MVLKDTLDHARKNAGPSPDRRPKHGYALNAATPRPVNDQVRVRIPVWRAISMLWLQQVLEDHDLRSIARVLAESPFDWEEIQRIFLYEVAPVVHENLRKGDGVWGAFDTQWLAESIMKNVQNPHYRQEALRNREYWTELVVRDWGKVKDSFREFRLGRYLSPAEQREIVRLLERAEEGSH